MTMACQHGMYFVIIVLQKHGECVRVRVPSAGVGVRTRQEQSGRVHGSARLLRVMHVGSVHAFTRLPTDANDNDSLQGVNFRR